MGGKKVSVSETLTEKKCICAVLWASCAYIKRMCGESLISNLSSLVRVSISDQCHYSPGWTLDSWGQQIEWQFRPQPQGLNSSFTGDSLKCLAKVEERKPPGEPIFCCIDNWWQVYKFTILSSWLEASLVGNTSQKIRHSVCGTWSASHMWCTFRKLLLLCQHQIFPRQS